MECPLKFAESALTAAGGTALVIRIQISWREALATDGQLTVYWTRLHLDGTLKHISLPDLCVGDQHIHTWALK